MARQIWLVRHGDAEPHGARHDTDRRLTERGERQAEAAARALEGLGVRFDAVYTSPRVRARDTARPLARALGVEPMVHQPLNAGFDADEALALAEALPPDGRMVIVGHNPDFEQIVHDLTGARVDFKKGGVAAVKLDGGRRGSLLALLRPRDLDRMDGGGGAGGD